MNPAGPQPRTSAVTHWWPILPLFLSSSKARNNAHRTSVYILCCMKIVKVRRVGNSNVVSIPREYEANGYTPGTSVLVEELPGGELRLLPTEKLREQIAQIGRRVVADHPEALRILAEHDPDR